MDYSKKIDKNFPILVYKIFNDILSLLLVALFLFLLAESILPGIISSHLSFLKLILIIFIFWASIVFLGRKNNFQFSLSDKKNLLKSRRNRRIVIIAIIFFLILITNSLFKFSPWEILVIAPLSCFALIYFYKIVSVF